MSNRIQDSFKKALNYFSRIRLPQGRVRLLFLLVPAIIALVEFFALGLARRTFVFYALNSGRVTVEDRVLEKSKSRELNISRYVEESLLGPFSPDSLPLFPSDTRLQSLMYRNGVVYADFSEEAVLPPPEGGEAYTNFQTLHNGIRRNFPFVRDIRFFIAGRSAYADEFRPESGTAGPEGL